MASWLFRIAKNLRIDAARSAARRGQQTSHEETPEQIGDDGITILESRSDLAAAQRAMQALPEDQRLTFTLVVLEGMSYRDTADLLEIPVGTVMSRLARARARIDAVVGYSAGALQ